jgi:hypothetical protein
VWAERPDDRGKISEALWITSTYAEEVECDLQRYYGLDFRDLFLRDTRLTWRRLLVLLRHLPPESALNTAIRNDASESELARSSAQSDPTQGRWSATDSMLASILDEIRMGNWAYVQVHSEQSVRRPEPIRRPGVSGRRSKVMTLEDAMKIDPRLRGMEPDEAQSFLDGVRGRG